jgi:VanZ family protein
LTLKKGLILVLWIAGILFPLAWLGTLSPGFGRWFNAVFHPAWVHVAMHSLLYAVLACLLAWILHKPGRSLTLVLLLGIVLGVALLQEGFQAITTDPFSVSGIGYDLVVDFTGALVGLFVFSLVRWLRLRSQVA